MTTKTKIVTREFVHSINVMGRGEREDMDTFVVWNPTVACTAICAIRSRASRPVVVQVTQKYDNTDHVQRYNLGMFIV